MMFSHRRRDRLSWGSCTVLGDPEAVLAVIPARFDHDGATLAVGLSQPSAGSLAATSVRFPATCVAAARQGEGFLEMTRVSPTVTQLDLALDGSPALAAQGAALLDALRRHIEQDVVAGSPRLSRPPRRESRALQPSRAAARCPLARA